MPADTVASTAVSVVLPAWNRAGSIRMAVDSILRQSFTDFELLVVDDGSTDGTMEALADLSDPRLRLLANPRNMGASAARNTGIRAAQGAWVAFHDSDDEWLPQKLEKQMARLEMAGPDTVGCYCGMVTLWNPGQVPAGGMLPAVGRRGVEYVPDPRILPVEGDIRPALLHANPVSTQMLVARRDALLKIGGFDETLPALVDWDCVIRLAGLGPFAFVDEPLVLQFFSENSITRSRRKRADARAQIIRKHHAFFAAHPKILAGHHVSIAGELRRLGDSVGARKALGQALRIRPLDPLILAKWLWLAVRPGLRRPPGG
jgi:glycosyltransferase involved in cell wall biosynthesis